MTDLLSDPAGTGGRLFADPSPSQDETSFQVDNTSSAYYDSAYYTRHKADMQSVPPPRSSPPRIDLADILGKDILDPIVKAKKITFHAVGDTGAARNDRSQHAATSLAHEAGVADAMVQDVAAGGAEAPAFFFHLGDVVYSFGEGKYYYDQFYEPFRNYDRPIFAIPGNHDGMVFGDDPDTPSVPTLAAFLRNFCTAEAGPSPDAGGSVRTTMTQPGVYFTLDAPFVSIIGLYTNASEGPGAISSQGGKYPTVDESQVDFLTEERSSSPAITRQPQLTPSMAARSGCRSISTAPASRPDCFPTPSSQGTPISINASRASGQDRRFPTWFRAAGAMRLLGR
jgi:hypothetical protein